MTVASTANRKSYAGDGSTTAFTFPYLFLANADLKVILVAADGTETVQTITTHYTLTGAGEASGGTVTMLTAPAAGETLVIYRDPETTQGLDLVTNDALPADAVEEAFDKLTMLAQRTRELVNRSVHLTDGDDDLDMILPPVVDRAGKYLGFDEDGLPSAVAGAGDATPISDYGATLVIAADAGAARTVLGLGTMALETAADYAKLSSSAPFTATQTMPQLAIKAVDASTDPAGYLRDENGAAVGIWFYDRTDNTLRVRHSGNLKDIIIYESGGVALTGAAGGDPGAGGFNAASYQANGAALPFQKAYVSSEQTITSAGSLVLAHGLGAVPALITVRLKCIVAEHGYTVGDEVEINNSVQSRTSTTDHGLSLSSDATNLMVRYGAETPPLLILDKTTGITRSATNASWRLILRAWA